MLGVSFIDGNGGTHIAHVLSVSQDLKAEVRERLSEICNGTAKALGKRPNYTYSVTLKEFLVRFDSKSETMQKGMLGELLTHILLLNHLNHFKPISPLFNMEERNVKKGFDLVLHDTSSEELWFSEVKSGTTNGKSSLTKTKSLVSNARNDIKSKLNSSNHNLWQNAINGAIITISSPDLKQAIEQTLEEYDQLANADEGDSERHNVILATVVFNTMDDPIGITEVSALYSGTDTEFKDRITFCIQKNDFDELVNFLRQEAEND